MDTPDKVLPDKTFNIAKNTNMINIKEVLFLMFIDFSIKNPLQIVVSLLKKNIYQTKN